MDYTADSSHYNNTTAGMAGGLTLPGIFAALPGAYLLLTPGFVIVAASDAYLAATLTTQDQLLGRNIFEVLPDKPDTPDARGVSNLQASLQQVLATGQPHQMAVQRYNVPAPGATGSFIKRNWLLTNTPVLDDRGAVSAIIHCVVNVADAPEKEQQLQQNQEVEQEARADADAQRQRLHDVLMQLPAMICIFDGPSHIFSFVNAPYQSLVGERPLLGRPIAEAMPELADQQIFELLDVVYRTGKQFQAHERLVQLDQSNSGRLGENYYDFVYQPLRSATGEVDGILVFAYDVTEQVLVRRQIEESRHTFQVLNEELSAANEELQVASEEITTSNADLRLTEQALLEVNNELESRVAERTRDLQRAQAEAERQKSRLERLFMQAPAAICILDGPNMVFELVNPAYQQLFPGRQLRGKPILEALPEIAGHEVFRTLRDVYATGIPHEERSLLIPLAHPDGGQLVNRYFNYIQQARLNERGGIDGVLVFAFEVTEQVEAQQASEASANQLRLITDALPVLISYLDREEKYLFVNQAYEEWFGVIPEALLGRTAREVVGPEAYSGIKGYIDRALAGERLDFEARMPYREGFVKYIRTSYVPDVKEGTVQGFYSMVNDITEQTEAQRVAEASAQQTRTLVDELGLINIQLTRTNADLDNFIYTASHDLKAPISNIEGLLYALREELPSENPEGVVGPILMRMQDSVERFKRTLTHLTEVSKLQKEHAPTVDAVDLAAVIDGVRLDLAPLLLESEAKLTIDVTGCSPVMFPEKNLRSVVYNLLSNALKYRHPSRRPHIDVHCHEDNGYAVLAVHDNGLGIPSAQQPKLFTMFQRFHDHVEGSGVGLYMVKKMVENAGGRIEVHSKAGSGSTFLVYFKA